jgi:hypothetical protein
MKRASKAAAKKTATTRQRASMEMKKTVMMKASTGCCWSCSSY